MSSLISLSMTYLISFRGSQKAMDACAEWTFINVIMPVPRSPARNPAEMCFGYKFSLLTY